MGWTNGITEKEMGYIREHFEEMTISEIALALGRSYEAVRNHAVAMKLHKFHKWTDEEDLELFELYGKLSTEEISRKLNVDINSVYNRVRRLKKNGRWYKMHGRGTETVR